VILDIIVNYFRESGDMNFLAEMRIARGVSLAPSLVLGFEEGVVYSSTNQSN
jgi:hypothetical protein